MNDFILTFFRGRLNPPQKTLREHRKANEQDRIADELMEKLVHQLTDENKELFLNVVDAFSSVWFENQEESFVLGFRLGAKFAQDTFQIDGDAIEDLFVFEY